MKSIIFSTGLRYAALLVLVTDLSGGSPPAVAQQPAQPSSANESETATIIVSARKREESLAQVPTSITAFTAETLKDYNVQSFSDYATKTPDLSFTYGGVRPASPTRAPSRCAVSPGRTCSAPRAPPVSTSTTPRYPAHSIRASWTSPASKS